MVLSKNVQLDDSTDSLQDLLKSQRNFHQSKMNQGREFSRMMKDKSNRSRFLPDIDYS